MLFDKNNQYIFRCNGKSDCQVTSSVGFAGNDPCFGTTKYTEVAHRCI